VEAEVSMAVAVAAQVVIAQRSAENRLAVATAQKAY